MAPTITDEQLAARQLVRDWAAGSQATAAIRDVEQGKAEAWRPVYEGLAALGIFGVAVAEDSGGAGGRVEDLCAMVDEAAKALAPGPVATTALATLVISDTVQLGALLSGGRFAGMALDADIQFDRPASKASGTAPRVLGAVAGGLLLLPADGTWLVVDSADAGVTVQPLTPTDFSRALARV
ncbi:MAG: acyl-CoA dehydrogenase family protein, partial [Mycobacterium sp.]|uniref:acyl-CoA dehydrogenase family protein n=1 Tax=Mycobacterium sp. TaxID=1785 RepID=UPI003CC56ADF